MTDTIRIVEPHKPRRRTPMSNPIDIIANALSKNGWVPSPEEGMPAATVAANALTDERIARRTYQTLAIRGTYDVSGPGGLEGLVREVLRLVGES